MSKHASLCIVEIAEGVAGPVCGLQFADLGARVIKIEPEWGDRAREWGPPVAGDDAAIFAHLNRGKQSVVLDPADNAARTRLDSILAMADAVVVHPDPGEADGIDWQATSNAHPRLVVCEIDDVGPIGPLAGRSGSELTLQAMSGFTRYIGEPGGEPCRVGYEIVGVATGMAAFQAISAALLLREKTGAGQYVRVSALGAILSMKTILLAAQSGAMDAFDGFHLNGPHWPVDTGWDTSDGQVTFDFRHGERDGWVGFCKATGLDHLPEHPDYKDWRSTIYIGDRRFAFGQPYREVFARMTCAEANDLINGLGGISVKFQNYTEVLAHPQVALLEPLIDVPEAPAVAQRQVGSPFRFPGHPPVATHARAPRLGEHTASVLAETSAAHAARAG